MPMGRLTTVVTRAVIRLTLEAAIHSMLPKNASYQRNDHSLGGNCRKRASENDIGTTISTGRIRYSRIAATRTLKSTWDRRI
ncbi:hypothetical protein D3C84_1124960 [compost metagenome]